MSSRRSLALTLVIVVIGFIAGLLWMRAPSSGPVKVAAPVAPASPVRIAEAPKPTASPTRMTIRTETAIEPVDESQITAEQAKAVAQRYRELAKFPKTSRPLTDGIDPIAKARAPKVEDNREPGDAGPHLIVYPSNTSFESPGEIVIYAEIVEIHEREVEADNRGGKPPKMHNARVAARDVLGEIRNSDGATVATLQFHDDGRNGDAQAEDQFYTAAYTPDPDKTSEFHGLYQILATASTLAGDPLSATNSFTYSVQIAHLTGNYRDSLVDGNLQIDAEVEVEEPGQFHLEGTLVTAADAKMVGYAVADTNLPAGTAWVPLPFYGLMFHQMNAAGPYQLFSVTLATVEDGVVQHADVVPAAHTTAKYEITQFTEAPYNEPDRMQNAEHYDAIARSKSQQ